MLNVLQNDSFSEGKTPINHFICCHSVVLKILLGIVNVFRTQDATTEKKKLSDEICKFAKWKIYYNPMRAEKEDIEEIQCNLVIRR